MAYRDPKVESVGEYEFKKSDLIGHGAFALVYRGRHKLKGDMVAIKNISKKKVNRSSTVLEKEINILKGLQHRNIVQLFDCKETAQNVFLVIEFCNGGDLSEYLQAKGTLSEDTIRFFLRQIVAAMEVLNSKGIVHRDLKPQNLLLSHESTNPKPHEITIKIATFSRRSFVKSKSSSCKDVMEQLLITKVKFTYRARDMKIFFSPEADFGFARYLQNNVMAATMCGSPMYMAPEVITSNLYNAKADLWSIGTIVFQCLVGKAPFQANNPQELRNFYEKHKHVTPRIPSGTSRELKDLLFGLLKKDLSQRISFQDFFNHPFVTMAMKYSSQPVPVPTRGGSHEASPIPSNNSDPRFVIPLSPSRGHDASSPSADREVALTMAMSSSPLSSKDSEEFVIVSHPMISSSEIGGMDANPSTQKVKHHPGIRKTSGAQVISGRYSPFERNRASSSPISYGHRRPTQTPPPLASSPSGRRGCQQILGSRKSSLSGGLGGVRYSSSPKDRRHRSDSKPSPSPIPVPTQIENYEKMERKHSLSSCSPASPSNYELSRKHSTSTDGGSPVPIGVSPNSSSPVTYTSPPSTRRVRRQSTKMVEFSTIPEQSGDETVKSTNDKSDSGRSSMSKAQTVPDLVKYGKLHTENSLNRCQSSSKLSEQVMRMLLTNKQQVFTVGSSELNTSPGITDAFAPLHPHTVSRGSLTPPNSPNELAPLMVYNNPQLPRSAAPSLVEQAKHFVVTSPKGRNTDFPVGSHKFSSNVEEQTSLPGHIPARRSGVAPKSNPEPNPTLPDHVSINENVLTFYCKLADAIDDVASEHVIAFDCQLTSPAFMNEATKRDEAFSTDPLHNVTQEQRQAEQVLLYLRSLHILSTSLITIKSKYNERQIQLSEHMKQLIMDVNKRYKSICHRCQVAVTKCDVKTLKQRNLKSADRLLYYYAVHDCRTSALAEMYEGNIKECMERYKRAVVLLEGLAMCATHQLDKQRLEKYKTSIRHRLKHLSSIWSPTTNRQLST